VPTIPPFTQRPPHLLKSSASSKAALPAPWSCWKRAITPELLLLPAGEMLLLPLLLLLLLLVAVGSGSTVQDRREGEEAAEGEGAGGAEQ